MGASLERSVALLLVTATLACSSATNTTAAAPAPKASSKKASTAATLGVPPGHLPPPGQCRVWQPGTPPGHQRKPESCRKAGEHATAGSWVLFRPTQDKKLVYVYERAGEGKRAGTVVRVRVYDATDGKYMRDEPV